MCSGLENGAFLNALSGTCSKHGLNSDFLMCQINGSLQMEHALLFTFLDASSDCMFRDQLHSLHSQQIVVCQLSDDDELQTDGNRSGHFQNGELGEQAFLIPQVFLNMVFFFPHFLSLPLSASVFSIETLLCVAVGREFNVG